MTDRPTQPPAEDPDDAAAEFESEIWDRLKQAIQDSGESYRSIDQNCGFANGTISKAIRTRRKLEVAFVFRIAQFLQADLVAILTGGTPEAPLAPKVELQKLHSAPKWSSRSSTQPQSGAPEAPLDHEVEPEKLQPELARIADETARQTEVISDALRRLPGNPEPAKPLSMSDEEMACGFMIQYTARNKGKLPTDTAIAKAVGVDRRQLKRWRRFLDMQQLLKDKAK